MFYIKLFGNKVGKIKINDFEEKFEVIIDYWLSARYEEMWKKEIRDLIIGNKGKIALMTWMHKPGQKSNYRAWVLYREGKRIFIQDMLFSADQKLPIFDENEALVDIPQRVENNEAGERISQWEISCSDLKTFLEKY